MKYYKLAPDTRGIGTPPSLIKDDNGNVVGYFDTVDQVRLRFARYLVLQGIFNEGGIPTNTVEAIKDVCRQALEKLGPQTANGIDDIPSWEFHGKFKAPEYASPQSTPYSFEQNAPELYYDDDQQPGDVPF